TTGQMIGTFLQDRATAIAGKLGPGPRMLPLTLTMESERAPRRTFHFNVVNDQLFTPLMTFTALLDTITSYERQMGDATYSISGKATLKDHDAISFNDIFSGDKASSSVSSYVVSPIAALMGNEFEKVELDGLDLTIKATEQPRTAALERVWLDDPRPR